MSGADEDTDFTEDLVGVEEYAVASPPKKDFFAWHRPRKQFVRDEQWCVQICKMLDEANGFEFDNNTLTYCGLPGSDLIDLRCFHDTVCAPRAMKLRFLGFNSAAAPQSNEQIELNISLDEVTKLVHVDPVSEVIPDDIRTVANNDSMAWAKVLKFGPFDVINLDLCDSFGTEEAGLFNDNYYNAMSCLMAIQARRKAPWLLLLTTRVGADHVHAETLSRFRGHYTQNLIECEGFRNDSQKAFKISDEDSLLEALKTATGIHSVFLVGVCKWLLTLAVGYQSSAELKSILGYRVVGSAPTTDLVSIALRFTPHPIPIADPLQLSNVSGKKLDECELAGKLLRRVAKQVDVDQVLASDPALFEEMARRTGQLLEAARYDATAYSAWVASAT